MATRISLERLHGLRAELRRRGIRRDLWGHVLQEAEDLFQQSAPESELDEWLDQLESDHFHPDSSTPQ